MGDRTERNKRTAPARNLYNAVKYDNITFRLKRDGSDGITREMLLSAAQADGVSLNTWILEALKDRL